MNILTPSLLRFLAAFAALLAFFAWPGRRTGRSRMVMYAMGDIAGKTYTNSLEAYQYWRKQGITAFEFDVFKFSDGGFGAIHSYTETAENLEIDWDENNPPTLSEFLQMRLCSKSVPQGLTPLSLEEIIKLMAADKKVRIVIDTLHFQTYEAMAELVTVTGEMARKHGVDASRIEIEAYTQEAAAAITADGRFLAIMFLSPHQTMNIAGINTAADCVAFLKSNKIGAASYPWYYGRKNPEYYTAMKKAGIKLYSFGTDEMYLAAPRAFGVEMMGIHKLSDAGWFKQMRYNLIAKIYAWSYKKLNKKGMM